MRFGFRAPVQLDSLDRLNQVRAAADRSPKTRLRGSRRKNPSERQNPKKLRLEDLTVPAAVRIGARNLLISKHFHRFVFRERCLGALSLQVDIMTALRAKEDYSVGFVHTS
jgi:hypothetical protein